MTQPTRPMVNPAQAVGRGFAKYANFRGRATRSEFWWWWLFTVIVGGVLAGIDRFTGHDLPRTLFVLAVLLPTSAVTSRRLHDVGKPSWWKLVWLLNTVAIWLTTGAVLSVTAIVKFRLKDAEGLRSLALGSIDSSILENLYSSTPILVVFLVAGMSLAIIVWSIVWLARPGESGQNRFGPDPRE